jgi:DnaJ-domain-containing protein 1
MLLDQLQKIGTGLKDAKQLLIPNRNWQGFTSSMDDAMKAMGCLSHYASQNQDEQTSERENAGHQVPPSRDSQGHYACLGLQPDASSEAIRAEYKKLAFRFHPDRNPHDTEWAKAKFQRLQEAYEVLGDEQKRKKYDLL